MAIVFTYKKFESHLIGVKTIIYIDHFVIKYLFDKKDVKPRLIYWILLMQEFNIEIKDKKGLDNVVADHLYRLDNRGITEE